jgi:hypothetical protein
MKKSWGKNIKRWRLARRRALARDSARRHSGVEVQPVAMHPQPEHIPDGYALTRRPTRDDREEELQQLRTADGRVMALVERVDPSSLPN